MEKKPKNALRIITFNVHFGRRTDAIANAFIKDPTLREADVIFFQEIESHEGEKISRANKIAEALSFTCEYAPARLVGKTGTHGLAIASRFPLSDMETVTLPRFSMHFRTRERIAMNASIVVNGKKIRLSNVHLDTRLASTERIAQVRPLVQILKNETKKGVVLGGDFNTLPFEFRRALPIFLRDQKRMLYTYLEEEGFHTHCETGGRTMRYPFNLDGIHLRNLQAIQCGVLRHIRVSDHKPVWLDVEV